MWYKRNLKWLLLSGFVIALDQLTKYLAVKYLILFQPKSIFPFVNFTLAYNPGAAFSFLSLAGGWQRWLFMGIAVIVSIIIIFWLMRIPSKNRYLLLGLSLIVGGALGNFLDRIILGHVVDFIDLYVGQKHWPLFNIADSAICIGVFVLFVDLFRGRSKFK